MKTPEQIFIENAKAFEHDEVGKTELCTKKEAIKMMEEYKKHVVEWNEKKDISCHLKERIEKMKPKKNWLQKLDIHTQALYYLGSGLILGIIIGKFII